jgi:hypothetical protein
MLSTRRTRYVLGSGFALVATAVVLFVSIPAAQAVLKVTQCGPAINSAVTTVSDLSTNNSLVFVDVQGAAQNFTVPAGATVCVKVVFSAEAACAGSASGKDICFVQALIDGVQMRPQGGAHQAFVSEETTAGAHAYEWVSRVGAGSHDVRIQQKVGDANTFFELDDWTFDVQIYQ